MVLDLFCSSLHFLQFFTRQLSEWAYRLQEHRDKLYEEQPLTGPWGRYRLSLSGGFLVLGACMSQVGLTFTVRWCVLRVLGSETGFSLRVSGVSCLFSWVLW